jgi:hypothetical protein
MNRACALACVWCVIAAGPAAAQTGQDRQGPATRRIAFDTVAGTQDFFGEDSDWQTVYIVDAYTGIAFDRAWQVSFRPVLKRVRGEWTAHVDQLSVRHEFQRGASWRFEAGRFSSPIGLGMTELRPNLNAGVLWWHRPYYMPLPSLGPGLPRVSLISAVYPIGGSAAVSTGRWDARAAVVDRAPVEFWDGWAGSHRGPNVILGGGISPRQGVRIGAGSAWGHYAAPSDSRGAESYVMANVEGEAAFGYTRISGEWTRDQFHTAWGNRTASGWTVQGQQTLSPRLFLHSRATFIRSPEALASAPQNVVWRQYRVIETTAGYRLNPDITLRIAHAAMRPFGATSTDNQIGMSFIWARRWW